MKKITNQQTHDALIKAIKLLLRPLIRLLIHHHLTFPYMRELLKQLYIEVASEILQKDAGSTNHSRLYILTGVHRKDIKRLRQQQQGEISSEENLSLGGALIARWTGMPEFLHKDGSPRRLLKTGTQQQPGFDQLVMGASKDIRPRAMLDEWVRQGIVEVEDDHVVLNESAFIPAEDFENLCYYLGHNVHDHLATSTHNLLQQGEPMLERSVYYSRLTAESVETLRHMATTQSMELLTEINKKALQLHESDQSNPDATHRFRLGCYWHQQENES